MLILRPMLDLLFFILKLVSVENRTANQKTGNLKFWAHFNERTLAGRNPVVMLKKRIKQTSKVSTVDIQIKRLVLRVSNSKVFSSRVGTFVLLNHKNKLILLDIGPIIKNKLSTLLYQSFYCRRIVQALKISAILFKSSDHFSLLWWNKTNHDQKFFL